MANDRLYLRCACGEVYLLAKWWGWEFELWEGDRPLCSWLIEHQVCGSKDAAAHEMHIPWTLVNEDNAGVPHGK